MILVFCQKKKKKQDVNCEKLIYVIRKANKKCTLLANIYGFVIQSLIQGVHRELNRYAEKYQIVTLCILIVCFENCF